MQSSRTRRLLRENGLSIALLALFCCFLVGQILTGQHEYNDEQRKNGKPEVTLSRYLTTGHFVEATTENWESEFLQMGAYVIFTVFLFQRGSSESKKLHGKEAVDEDPRLARHDRNVPWPVRRGGWILMLYSNSLSIAFALLFVTSFVLHAWGGAHAFNEEREAQGELPLSTLQYLATSRFWFESFQNWQSEFLAIAAMVILSIFLRQRGSPESKPIAASHSHTGSEE